MTFFVLLWGLVAVVPLLQFEHDLYRWWLRRRDLFLGDYLHEYSGIFCPTRLTEWVDSPDPLTGLYHVTPAEFAALPHRPELRGLTHPLITIGNLLMLGTALTVSLVTGVALWAVLALSALCVAMCLGWQVRLLRHYRVAVSSDPIVDVDRMTGLEFMVHVRREHFRAERARARARHAREFPPSMRLLHRLACARRYQKWQRVIANWGGAEQVDAVIAARMNALSGLGATEQLQYVSHILRDESCRDLLRDHIDRARFAGRQFGRRDLQQEED